MEEKEGYRKEDNGSSICAKEEGLLVHEGNGAKRITS